MHILELSRCYIYYKYLNVVTDAGRWWLSLPAFGTLEHDKCTLYARTGLVRALHQISEYKQANSAANHRFSRSRSHNSLT